MKKTYRIAAALAAIALGAAGLAACGSGSRTPAATSDVSAEGVAAAKATIAPLLEAPNPDLHVQPLPKLPADAELVFIKCGVPACVPYMEGATAAAEAAGVKLTVLDAGNTPESQTRAWDQAVAANPAAVLEVGFQLSLFQKQIDHFKAAGIPVITAGDLGVEVDFNVLPPSVFETTGNIEANYIIAESEGTADILYVTTKEVPLLGPIQKGFEDAIAENCPGCTLDNLNIQLANIGRTIPGEIVSYLQRHPDTKWIALGFGDLAAGVPEALRGAGITGVNIIGGAGTQLNWAYIQSGDQLMDLAAGNALTGWQMFDVAVRLAAGEPKPEVPKYSQQILTKETLTFDPNVGWVPVPGYAEQFKAGWAS